MLPIAVTNGHRKTLLIPQMSLPSYIVRRQGSRNFYVRVPIPKDLQTRLGTPGKPRRERWQSLNTSDPHKARLEGRPIIEKWEREFANLRRPKQLTEAELQDAIWKRYLELITADERFRLSLPTEDGLKQIWAHLEAEFGGVWDTAAFRLLEAMQSEFRDDQRTRVARLAKIRMEAARGETQAVAEVVQQIIDELRLNVDVDSPQYRKLAHSVQRAEIEGLNRAAERDVGDWTGRVPKPALIGPWRSNALPRAYGLRKEPIFAFRCYQRYFQPAAAIGVSLHWA